MSSNFLYSFYKFGYSLRLISLITKNFQKFNYKFKRNLRILNLNKKTICEYLQNDLINLSSIID